MSGAGQSGRFFGWRVTGAAFVPAVFGWGVAPAFFMAAAAIQLLAIAAFVADRREPRRRGALL